MAKRKERAEPFPDTVKAVPVSGHLGETPFSALGQEREFEDGQGGRWTRRGDAFLDGKTLGKRVLSEQVLVWHEYGPEVTVVAPSDRKRFWQEAQERMSESAHSEFRGYEFKNAAGQVLLVVQEHC